MQKTKNIGQIKTEEVTVSTGKFHPCFTLQFRNKPTSPPQFPVILFGQDKKQE